MFSSIKHSTLSCDSAIRFLFARIHSIISRELDRIQVENHSSIMEFELHAVLAHVIEISKDVHLFHAAFCHCQQCNSNILLHV